MPPLALSSFVSPISPEWRKEEEGNCPDGESGVAPTPAPAVVVMTDNGGGERCGGNIICGGEQMMDEKPAMGDIDGALGPAAAPAAVVVVVENDGKDGERDGEEDEEGEGVS